MTNREVGFLTFRAISLYAFISALEQTERILYGLSRALQKAYDLTSQLPFFLSLFGPFILLLICSAGLWLFASQLSKRMFTKSTQITLPASITIADVQSVVFLAIGLYILTDTILPFAQTITSIYVSLKGEIDHSSQSDVAVLRISTALKIAAGLSLVFGAKGLTNILRKVRND